jgi:hypothetical protein
VIATCGHANRPCPPQRLVAAKRTDVPAIGPATVEAIAGTGARYETCPGQSAYLLIRDGKRELTEQELTVLQATLQATGAGVEMSGQGGVRCGSAGKPAPGVEVWVRDDEIPVEALAHRMAAAVGQLPGEPSARVQVMVRWTPDPRCAADDPACGPLPYDAACIERTNYSPKRERRFVRGFGKRGECRHDGECFVTGCGNDCVPARATDLGGTCEENLNWKEVYCGCVQTECAWFTTR